MGEKIYLVEDEENLNNLLRAYLEREGYTVISFFDGISALNKVGEAPDLWILDIMLPDIDGYSLLKSIKEQHPQKPVIFISAKNDMLDRVVGLELGSDDYLPKPFLPRELVIRVQLILSKQNSLTDQTALLDQRTIDLDGYYIDFAGRVIVNGADEIGLTHKEWQILQYFIENIGLVLSRQQILYRVWGDNYFGSDRVVDDTVRRLRKKMPLLSLETVYQVGYKLVKA